MAHAEKRVELIEKFIESEPYVLLTLSIEEASFPRTLFGRVGGCPMYSPRKYASHIDDVLADLKIQPLKLDGIYFG